MFIMGLGTAAPERRYTQKECWEVYLNSELSRQLEPRAKAIIRKVLTGNNGIESRHLALENLNQAFDVDPDVLHARFRKNAPELAETAARRAMANAHITTSDVEAILISTCTGYLCPGLTSYVSERLGLSPDILTLDLVGQGCGAAIPNLRAAEALVGSGKCDCVLSICVEVCSAALYFDNDPGVLISACLFGDGAGAAVLGTQTGPGKRIEWKASNSLLNPNERDCLRFEQKGGLLRNILTPQVPAKAGEHAEKVFAAGLKEAQIPRDEIKGWVLHPGGRDVVLALRERLGLSEPDTRWSEAVLREYGNLSSPSVFFVLDAALQDSARDGYWWMSAFGAGFSCHGALLEVS
jgi:alkylresorcinol/alkylpyrone synthase